MEASENLAFAHEFLRTVSENRCAELADQLHPDFEYWTANARTTFSIDQIAGIVNQSLDLMPDGLAFVLGPSTVQGDRVAIQAESYGVLTNGAIYNNLYHFLFEFEYGQLRKIWEYNDTKHVTDVFNGE